MSRILHLIPGLTGGGAERQLTLLALAQSARGHEVHIGVSRPALPELLIGRSDICVHVIPTNGNHDPMLFVRVRNLIKSIRADIVQTWLLMMDVMGGAAALSTTTPWVLGERSGAEMYAPTWKNSLRVRMGKSAQAIVANSEGGLSFWQQAGASPGRLVVVPNAIDVDAIEHAPTPQIPASFAGRPLVLFVGRYSEVKMPFVLIDALAQAFSTSNAIAMLCGDGPLASEMQIAIDRHGISDRIILAGHRSDIFGLMRLATTCVAISRIEGSSNVVLEAMAAGCPLIISDIPAYRQFLDATNALIVPLGDSAATAKAIATTLGDVSSARARAELAKKRIETFSPSFVASKFDETYERVMRPTRR